MRQSPEGLRSVIMDAVVPIAYNLMTEPARAKQMIGEKYLLGCAQDPRCDAACPDLARRYLAMIDRLNADPVPLTVYPMDFGSEGVAVSLTGDLLEEALYGLLYGNVSQIAPLIVDRADQGDYSLIASVLLPGALFSESIAEGMHLATVCAERGKPAGPASTEGILPRLLDEMRTDAASQAAICEDWRIAALPPEDIAPVRSDLPVLMLSGAWDPITPPPYAESLLPQFPNAFHVIFPSGSHGQLVVNDCANSIAAAFLDDPEAPPATGCVPQSAPEVVTRDEVIFLSVLNRALAADGLRGLLVAGAAQIPALLAGLLLVLAPLVYLLGWVLRILLGWRRRRAPMGRGAAFALLAPPWISLATGLSALASIAGLSFAVAATLQSNEYLATMGAVPDTFRALLAMPWLVAALAAVMLWVAVTLWRDRLRSIAGRLGFSLLTLAAIGAAVNLLLLTR